jgi:hypothetical protein
MINALKRQEESVDIRANLEAYLGDYKGFGGRDPDERYTSFDYCFNYFQSFHETGRVFELANPINIQSSCLQLGFFLASWGMYRGSADLLQKSSRYLVPAIEIVARTEDSFWGIDAHCYTKSNIESICVLAGSFLQVYPRMSNILLTKIMLGVFGIVPAFDANFRQGCNAKGITATFGQRSLSELGKFYHDNAELIDEYRVPTLDFCTGEPTLRIYTRAKVIDMAFFMEGLTVNSLKG